MAKISTYPIISVPTLNDLLIGTDVENINETKNFTIDGITNLILVDSYVPYINATKDVDLGIYSITASAFIVPGGLASQFVKADGSLDSTVYQVAGDYITGLSGEATASGPGVASVMLNNGAVIGKVLTGLTITGGSVSSTDTILQAFGKVQNQINSLVGGVQYQGTWNAATNTPTLQSGVGTKGYYYVVSVAGSTNLDGITDWNVGDWAIYDGSAWQQVDNTDTVVSVNGKVGVVVLTTSDIAEGTNLYYTDIRARSAISLTTTGNSGAATYDNLTGVFNIPNYTLAGLGGVPLTRQLTINGTTYDLSSNRTWDVGTVTQINTTGPITGGPITGSGTIGITQSGASTDGYLSSIDWNTFNNKQNALTNPVTGTGTVYTLPMWSGLTTLMDSPLSYASNVFTFQYNSPTGGSVVFTNSSGTPYAYTIQMNNFGTPRATIHQYTDGQVAEYINGVQVSRMFQSGNYLLGVGVVDPGRKLSILGDLYVDTIVNATTDTDKFIVSDGGVIKYRTGAQVAADIGAVTSVGLSMPSAFNVANSPITSSGTLTVTGAGLASQYIRGDGTLADFPSGGGGGSSVSYYLNGSINQGIIGGVDYKEMSKVPVLGTGTDFSVSVDGYIASFITDAGDPSLLNIPAGNWNFETYFSASSGGGTPTFYVELYKYDGTTFTLIASSATNPELISFGTNIQPYFSTLAVPQTTLAVTDRLAVRYFVNTSGRTITLHTENNHLCQIITTFTTGITALNGLTEQVQYLQVGTSGTDFNISSSVATHIFNLPVASAVNTGKLSAADWTTFNNKPSGTGAAGQVTYWSGTNTQAGSNNLFWDNVNVRLGIGTNSPLGLTHIKNANVLSTALSGAQLIVEGFASTILQLASFNTGFISLSFGDQDDGNDGQIIYNNATRSMAFEVANSERLRIYSTGNVSIGSITDDTVNRLQVTGNARVTGSGNTSASTALIVQNSDGTNMFRVRNDQQIFLNSQTNFGNVQFYPVNNGAYTIAANATELRAETTFISGTTTGGFGFSFGTFSAHNTSAPNILGTTILGSFSPTSGTQVFSQLNVTATINQTGGANGITIGLYINPILTAAADWRSIQWSNNTGWGLYGAGTANNYLAGSLGIGTTSLTGYNLRVSKGILNDGTGNGIGIASDGITANLLGSTQYFRAQINTSAGTNTDIVGYAAIVGTSAATITNLFGFVASSTLISATNNYGFYGNLAAGTGRWNIYMNGTADNYLAGSLGIGTTTLNNSALRVNKAVTGAVTQSSIANSSTINSDVTSNAWMYVSSPSSQAAVFTLSEIVHFNAFNLTIGAGSSISSNIGFKAESNLTGATNNFGFFGNIPSGTGRWNLYMAGTAINYMNGALLLGNTTDDTVNKLQVTGNAKVVGSGNTSGSVALTIQNSDGANMLRVRNDQKLLIGQASTTAAPSIYAFSGITGDRSLRIGIQSAGSLTPTPAFNINQENDYTYTTGTGEFTTITANFLPTSGTGTLASLVLRPTINQTGGANGITRGLYINPTLTSAADWRAIEVSAGITVLAPSTTSSASLRLPSGTAPTTPVNGDIWSTSTDLLARINNTTYSLINSGLSGSGATGQVTFWDSATNITGSNNLFWDNTNGRLGIGTNVPARQLVIYDAASGVPHVQWANASTGVTSTDGFQIRLLSTNQVHFTNFENSAMYFGNQGISGQMTFYPSGNLAIGTSASDLGQRLQVAGNALIAGSGNTSASTALTVNNSDGTNLLRVGNSGITTIGSTSSYITIDGTSATKSIRLFTSGAFDNIITVVQGNYFFGNTGTLSDSGGSVYAKTIYTDNIISGSNGTLYNPLYLQGGSYNNHTTASIGFASWDGGSNTQRFIIYSRTIAGVGGDIVANPNNGNFIIGTTVANRIESAQLQIESTTKGFLPPRMTQAQRQAIVSPAEGLIVYQTDSVIGLYIYANSVWRTLGMI